MTDITTLGTILVNESLPKELQKRSWELDKKGVHKLFMEIAEKYPQEYKQILNNLSDIGRTASWTEGVSVSLAALASSKAKAKILGSVSKKLEAIINNDRYQDTERKQKIVDTLLPVASELQQAIADEAEARGSPFHWHIKSGARGNKANLASLAGADLLATDQNDEFVPLPLLHSYAEGYTPAEYFASTFGQRRGMLNVKLATAEAGFASKQLVNAAHRIVVTKDTPTETRLPVGYPTTPEDKDNIGAVLAQDVAGFKAGAIITAGMLEDMKDAKVDKFLVHSVLTEPSEDGGVSKLAVGRRLRRGFHLIGDNIGVSSAQAIGEKLSQGMLSCLISSTLVRMADGSVQRIDNIKVGDFVLGADKDGRTFPVKVTSTFDNGWQGCYIFIFRTAKKDIEITCTAAHKVLFAPNHGDLEVAAIGNAKHLSSLRLAFGEWARFKARLATGAQHVYDIEVAHPDHLFVLANGMIVSNSKHTAGVSEKISKSGFEFLNRLLQAPDEFPESGPLARVDGVVKDIKPAPQGGFNIHIGDELHYVRPGINPIVKVGSTVEAGDDLTDGTPHPDELIKYKGMGAARKRYMLELQQSLKNTGIDVHRRNAEVVVSGLLNWSKITDPNGLEENIYDDIVPYNRLAFNYKPRKDAKENAPKHAIGQYLEEPVLHYTPGTRITKSVAKDLDGWKIKGVYTHPQPPAFEPVMVRSLLGVYHDPDWKVRLGGFYTASAFQKALHRGLESDTKSTSYIPAVANPNTLGKNLSTQGKYGTAI